MRREIFYYEPIRRVIHSNRKKSFYSAKGKKGRRGFCDCKKLVDGG